MTTAETLRAIAAEMEAQASDAEVVVTWRNGYRMEYEIRGGHNVRLTGHGVTVTTGESSLADALRWAGQHMASA